MGRARSLVQIQSSRPTMAGRLEVITGCMFSGKSEELIRRVDRANIAGQTTLLFKPHLDDRYSKNAVVTHYGREFEAKLLKTGEESISTLGEAVGSEELEGLDIVAFDEGNFFSEDLSSLVLEIVSRDKRVIVAGLDLTFAGDPFHPMPRLMAEADRLDKLHAVCTECGDAATRTQRLVDGNPAPADDQVIKVGGKGDYEARCRDCWELG
ncbi:MAG: thymidine kinase [Candidatus Bipolaricaulota bacterium]|nr:thymidine kinase [Candidatus Bipolaricaulota bacterium]